MRANHWVLGAALLGAALLLVQQAPCLCGGKLRIAWRSRSRPWALWPAASVVLATLWVVGVRWEQGALGRAACIAAGLAVAGTAARSPQARSWWPWILGGLAAACLCLAGLVHAVGRGTGSLLFHEVWQPGDVGLLSPALWRELAAPLAAMALPLVIGEGRLATGARRWCGLGLTWLLLLLFVGSLSVAALAGAMLGVAWAAVWGRWLRGRRLLASVGIGILLAGIACWLPTEGLKPLRAKAVEATSEWATTHCYIWTGALRACAEQPLAGHGLLGFGRAYGVTREVRWLTASGLDRPATAVSDPLLLAAEAGVAGVAGLVVLVLWGMARTARSDPALSGAIVAGTVVAAVSGHTFAVLNAWCFLLTVGLAWAQEGGNPAPTHASAAVLSRVAAVGAVLAACLAAVAPVADDGLHRSRAAALWYEAALAPTGQQEAVYERAAAAFSLRLAASNAAPTRRPSEAQAERRLYAAFCRDYSQELRRQGRYAPASAYDALAEQLLALDDHL